MNIMGIVFLAIMVLCGVRGWRRGLTGKLAGVVSVLISCLLVSGVLPVVTQTIRTATPVYDMAAAVSEEMINTRLTALLSGYTVQGVSADEAAAYGMSGSDMLNGMTKIEQTKLIKQLPIPSVVQKTILNYNNSAGYRALGAGSFASYLARFLANGIVNIIAFAATMVIIYLVVRLIIGALNLLTKLPILYEVNRVGGLVCGLLQGMFILWAIMLVLSAVSGTSVGAQLLSQADANVLLKPLFESNLFMRIVTQVTGKL